MIDPVALREIEDAVEKFAEGNPMHFKVDVVEGVWFDFDCPFDEDLDEMNIPVCIGIKEWSPHNLGEPENYQMLIDYGEMGDELATKLDSLFVDSIIWEYSPGNSGNGTYLFQSKVDNPRTEYSFEKGEIVTKPQFA